jgi:hypothetical protein
MVPRSSADAISDSSTGAIIDSTPARTGTARRQASSKGKGCKYPYGSCTQTGTGIHSSLGPMFMELLQTQPASKTRMITTTIHLYSSYPQNHQNPCVPSPVPSPTRTLPARRRLRLRIPHSTPPAMKNALFSSSDFRLQTRMNRSREGWTEAFHMS